MLSNHPGQALPYYQRIVARYPRSQSVEAAELGVIKAFYALGEYQKVIAQGQIFLKKDRSADIMCSGMEILGDAFFHSALPARAADTYARALDVSLATDSDRIAQKLKDAVSKLSTAEVLALLKRPTSPETKSRILLMAGRNYLDSGQMEDASRMLTTLTEQYPDQEAAHQAMQMLQDVKAESAYQNHLIGCLLPLTGMYETYGKKALKGIELAQNQFAQLNPDQPLTIRIQDTESDPQKTIAAVKDLSDAGVAAIIGPVATADIAAAEAQKYGIPIITLTQKDQITRIGASVFRNFMTPGAQVAALVSYVSRNLGLRRFAILYPDEPYGVNFMNLFKEQAESAGCRIVVMQVYDPSQTDFRETLQKLSSRYQPVADDAKTPRSTANPEPEPASTDGNPASGEEFEALFIPDSPQKVAVIVPQLAFGKLRPAYLLGTNLWHSPKLITMGGPSIQGSILPDGFFAESPLESVQQFIKTFNNAYKEIPGYIEAASYDTAMMMLQIVSNPDIHFRSSIQKELLRPEGFSGVTGKFHFNQDREVQKNLILLQIKGEHFVEITPP
jgi:ABC-type branched-subunit amino acid transport system substrate-binding protein